MAPTFAASAEGELIDCGKVAAACLEVTAVPEDVGALDAAALEQIITSLTQQLQVAKRVLQEKLQTKAESEVEKLETKAEPEANTLRHNDSFAINKDRLVQPAAPAAEVPLKHVNSMEINRQRLPEEPSLLGKAEGQRLYAAIAVGAAAALAIAFVIGRRSR